MATLPEFLSSGGVQERDGLIALPRAHLPLGGPCLPAIAFPPRSVLPFLAHRHTSLYISITIYRGAVTLTFSSLFSWFFLSPFCREDSIPTHHSGPSDFYWVSPAPLYLSLEFNWMRTFLKLSNFLQCSSGFSIGFVWQFSNCFLNSSLLSVKWATWLFRFPILSSRCSFSCQ